MNEMINGGAKGARLGPSSRPATPSHKGFRRAKPDMGVYEGAQPLHYRDILKKPASKSLVF
jgi:hypothetical protein